jgi:hypothetical protein
MPDVVGISGNALKKLVQVLALDCCCSSFLNCNKHCLTVYADTGFLGYYAADMTLPVVISKEQLAFVPLLRGYLLCV